MSAGEPETEADAADDATEVVKNELLTRLQDVTGGYAESYGPKLDGNIPWSGPNQSAL